MPTMPNVVGLIYPAAQLALQQAGVLNTQALGYFGAFPVSIAWTPSASPPSTILSQTPSSGSTVALNSAVTFTAAEYPVGAVFP